MPIILSQRTWQADPKYLDREGVIYHYPRQYFGRIKAFDRFIYYRPATGAMLGEASTYIGYGWLGKVFDDWARPYHRFIEIASYERFDHPVSIREGRIFVETEGPQSPQFQSAARTISDAAYDLILRLGGVVGRVDTAPAVTTHDVLHIGYSELRHDWPRDAFRDALIIPEGTGYQPSGKQLPDVYESAALQERARKDHNQTLELIRQKVASRGGACWYNNNVDLFARINESRMLIEAKSLTDTAQAVDRMRYGMGQLFDYRVRYEADLQGAVPVLAFGALPASSDTWLSTILEENGVAFVARVEDAVVPLNPRAERLPIFPN